MALTVTRITVATPTLDAITLGAGGSLVVGTTYYYRLVAVRQVGDGAANYCTAFSEASAEQSVTPTTGNQTAQLTWSAVANAFGYIVQRTTTSGSYPIATTVTGNSFYLSGQSYGQSHSKYPFATTLTALNDDGGAVSVVRFDGVNFDFATDFPVIQVVGASTADVATLYTIYTSLTGGGYTDLQLLGSTVIQANTNWQSEGVYTLRGHLWLKDCTFRHRGTLLTIPGDVILKENSCKVEVGSATVPYSPVFLRLGIGLVPYTNNNSTYAGAVANNPGSTIRGKSGETNNIDKMFARPIAYGYVGHYNTIGATEHSYGTLWCQYCDTRFSMFGLSVAYGLQITETDNSYDNIYEGGQPRKATVTDGTLWGAIIPYYQGNLIMKRCENVNVVVTSGSVDSEPWYGNAQAHTQFIDHTFRGRQQTDNHPYWYAQRNVATAESTVIISVTRNITVVDEFGNTISGATIEAFNDNGFSAFWEASGATVVGNFANKTDPGSITTSDGTLFSIGDYIRCETYAECMKVTNIVGNVLTVARAQLGTSARYYYDGGNDRILKMISSVSTDANGDFANTEPILQRELYNNTSGTAARNYEDTLVAAETMLRNFFVPYNLKVSKSGYKTFSAKLLDPDVDKFPLGPQTIEIALSKVKDLNFSKSVKRMSQ